MKLAGQIKPISWLKSNAAEIIRNIDEPLIITQNGEAKAVVQSIEDYEKTQETIALLKILAVGMGEIEKGRVFPLDDVVREIREG
ncbi:MAG: type II toxin-antitoxin system Phd/YefM family antitoxin [Geovibrio sp.]|nr:type II toxin-antitoxin system Phd/YefM family antitoxin [Geovibrio sp.]